MAAPRTIALPTLVQAIRLDPTGVKGGASAYTSNMRQVTKASTGANNAVRSMGTSINTLGFRAQSAGRILLKNMALPLAAVGAAAIKGFTAFESSMVRIESLVGVSTKGVENFTDAVKEASLATGRGPQELAEAMFFVASAGLRGSTAMEVLGASAKAAALGLGQTKVVADAATSAVNAYGAENLAGSEAVDVLTAAVREGKVEANRLAPAIGKAIPVASAMGIEFHEVAAAIASMTRTGTDARTSAIQLRQIMQSLLDPSRQATRAMKEMGIAEGELRRQADEEGLLAVLKRLRDLAHENEDAFADVFPNIRALAGALDITGANLEENEQIFASLEASIGDTDKAFRRYQETAQFKMTQAVAELKVAFIGLGESLRPLVDMTAAVIKAFSWLARVFADQPWLSGLMGGLVALTAVMGSLLIVGGKVATMLGFAGLAGIKAAGGIAAATASLTAFRAVMLASGIGALLVGFGLLANQFLGFGKESESTHKKLQKLSNEIEDVKIVAGLALKPLLDFGEAVRAVGAATREGQLIEGFFDTFGEAITEAGEDGGHLASVLQAEESIFRMFAGQGDSPEMRRALEGVVNQLQRELGDFDLFERIFTPGGVGVGEFSEEMLTSFLVGDDPEAQAKRVVGLWTERALGGLDKELKDVFEARDQSRHLEPLDIQFDFEAIATTTELDDVLGKFVSEFENNLRTGRLDEGFLVFETMMGNISNVVEELAGDSEHAAEDAEFAMGVVEAAFIQAMQKLDGFDEDAFDGIHSMVGFFEELNDPNSPLRDTEAFSGMDRIIALAEEFAIQKQALMDLQAMNLGAPLMTEAEIERRAINLSVQALKRKQEAFDAFANSADDAGDTVLDALETMRTGFATADAAAKEFTSRFDDLIGRNTAVTDSQIKWTEAVIDLREALEESGGSLDINTEAGRNALSNMNDVIDATKEHGAVLFEQGHGAEFVEGRIAHLFATLTANATAGNVSAEDLEEFMRLAGGTADVLALLTAQDDAPASKALMDQAQRIANEVGPFVFDEGVGIGENLFDGVVRGVQSKETELLVETSTILSKLVDHVKDELGISSPSVVFRDEVGAAMTRGMIQGFDTELAKSVPRVRNAIRDWVNDAISITQSQTGAASAAISAVLDVDEAERRLAQIRRDTAGAGISRREELTRKQLEMRRDEAIRALRLGQGHQVDLQLALEDAKNALDDFEATVGSDSEVVRAELRLAEAGEQSAVATAQLRMEGDAAITAFTNMAEAVGISSERINTLVTLASAEQDLFEDMFSEDVRTAIDRVAEGIGLINAELEKAEEQEYVPPDFGPESTIPREGTGLSGRAASSAAPLWSMGTHLGPLVTAVERANLLGAVTGYAGTYDLDRSGSGGGGSGFEQWDVNSLMAARYLRAAGLDYNAVYGGALNGAQLETADTTVGSITIQEMNVIVDEPSEVGPGMVESIHDSVMGRESNSGLGGPPGTGPR